MSKARLSVNFSGSLVELKAWLADMPDNLAGVLHTSFTAETKAESNFEAECRIAAVAHLQNNQKIAAIKAVRVMCAGHGHHGFLSTLRGAKAFVEELEFQRAQARLASAVV